MKRLYIIPIFLLLIINLFSEPKNVILCIGDGMGFNHVKISNYYDYGEDNKQIYQQFPIKLAMSTWSATNGSYSTEKAWESYEYLMSGFTDSSASITAITTGIKTDNTKLNFDPQGKAIRPIGDYVVDTGRSLGVVTTVPFSHATPAGVITSMEYRKDYYQIAHNMVLNSKASVIMSGGSPEYREDKSSKYIGPASFWKWLKTGNTTFENISVQDIDNDQQPDAWTFITNRDDFIKYGTGNTPKRLIGVNTSAKNGQQTRLGDTKANPYEVPFDETIASLKEMTKAALNVLDNNETGFFLMVEGGAIDYSGHYNQPGRLVEEMNGFNETIEEVCNWVEQNSSWDETLVIVTADHECGCVWGPPSKNKSEFNEIVNNGKDKLPGFVFNSSDHTNSLVPFYAKGNEADLFTKMIKGNDKVKGEYIDNTDIGKTLRIFFSN